MVKVPALRASGLAVTSATGATLTHDVDVDLWAGSTTALVGPSGVGKSLTLRAIAALLPPGLGTTGQVWLGETDLLTMSRRRLRGIRGKDVGWIGQDATASLNPTVTVGRHFTESIRAHAPSGHSRGAERKRAIEALHGVGLEAPEKVWAAYPFELSGGQAQRVAIALATLGSPQVVLADEVTAELDPQSRAGILRLLRDHANAGAAVLMVTHDLAAAAAYADQTVVMEAGRIVDQGPSAGLLDAPTSALVRAWAHSLARPSEERKPPTATSCAPVALRCSAVRRELHGHGRHTVALDDVDLEIRHGESIAVVGPSGSGKSTLVGVLAALDRPDTGALCIDDSDVWSQSPRQIRDLRRRVGLLFQDALSSFDPRYTVSQIIAEGLTGNSPTTTKDLIRAVGLDVELLGRRPESLSGGQCQRVALARAIAAEPTILLVDEPTSGLDVLAQDQLVEVINRTRRERGTTVVVVTHDLRLAQLIADRVVVLDHGRIVEDVQAADLDHATHPTTRGLLATTMVSGQRVGI